MKLNEKHQQNKQTYNSSVVLIQSCLFLSLNLYLFISKKKILFNDQIHNHFIYLTFVNRFPRAIELYLQGIMAVSDPVLHFNASAQKPFLFCAGKTNWKCLSLCLACVQCQWCVCGQFTQVKAITVYFSSLS